MHRNNFKNSCFINMFNEPNPTMNSCLKEFQISFHEFLTNQNESCLFTCCGFFARENGNSNSLSDSVSSFSRCFRRYQNKTEAQIAWPQ